MGWKKREGSLFFFNKCNFTKITLLITIIFFINSQNLVANVCLTENCFFDLEVEEVQNLYCCYAVQETDIGQTTSTKTLVFGPISYGECTTTRYSEDDVPWTNDNICNNEGVYDFLHYMGVVNGNDCGTTAGECRGEAIKRVFYDEDEDLCTQCNALKTLGNPDSRGGVWGSSIYGGTDILDDIFFLDEINPLIKGKLVGGDSGTCCGDDELNDNPDWAKNFCYNCKAGDNMGTANSDSGYTTRMWYPEASFASEDEEAFENMITIKITQGQDATNYIYYDFYSVYENCENEQNDICDGKMCGTYADGQGGLVTCGSCGNEQYCDEGNCECNDGSLTKCGFLCVNTLTNDNHCGGCNQACSSGDECVSGSCQTVYSCFVEGTQISMFDGTTKNIENMSINDKIIGYDTKENKKINSTVLRVDKHVVTSYYKVELVDGTIINVTEEHPLYYKKENFTGWASINPGKTKDIYNWSVRNINIIE